MTEIRSEIKTVCETVSGLSGNVHYGQAQSDETMPYLVFSIINDINVRDTATDFRDVQVQFSLFGETLTTLETINTNLETALLNESNYSFLSLALTNVKRDFSHTLPDEKQRDWQCVSQFSYTFQE